MTPSRTVLLIISLTIVFLIIAGCISQPATENRTSNVTVDVTIPPFEATQIQTQCPLSGTAAPWIIINPIGAHYIGDVFEINGTTNLGIDEIIPVDVFGLPMSRPYPGIGATLYGTNGTAKIWCGNSRINFWNYSVNSSVFNTNFYTVAVGAQNWTVRNFTHFEVMMHGR